MSDVSMVALYLGPALALVLLSRAWPWLRGQLGWLPMGSARRLSLAEVEERGIARIGTGRQPDRSMDWEGDWDIFSPSLGLRLLVAIGSALMVFYLFWPSQDGSFAAGEMSPVLSLQFLLLMTWGVLYVWAARVRTNGKRLRVRGLLLAERDYDLADLVSVEENATSLFRLTFADGKVVQFPKAVAGAKLLRQHLSRSLERNQRG